MIFMKLFLLAALSLSMACSPVFFTYQATPDHNVQMSNYSHERIIRIRHLIDNNTGPRYHIKYCAVVKDPIESLGYEIFKKMSQQDSTSTYIYGDTGTQPTIEIKGNVTKLFWTAYPELWSLIPPVIVVWPLHFMGLPVAPSHNVMIMDISFSIIDQSGTTKVIPIHVDYKETVIYSIFNTVRQDTKFQKHSLDSALKICTKRLIENVLQKSVPTKQTP